MIHKKYKTPHPLPFSFQHFQLAKSSYPDRFEILHDSIRFSGKILPGGELLDDDVLQTISYSQTGSIVPHLLTQLCSMQELAQNSNLTLQRTRFLTAVHFLQMHVHVIKIQVDFCANEQLGYIACFCACCF